MQEFLIFSAGCNCDIYVEMHMRSIQNQSYQNYRHLIIDDASTDATPSEIRRFADEKTTVISNTHNKKWNYNADHYLTPAIKNFDIVVVLVDLDDWLAHNNVLELLNKIYTEEECWLTFGQYAPSTGAYPGFRGEWQPEVIKNRTFRESRFCYSALRTFKGFLWFNLSSEDLKDPEGEYAKCTYDQAIMFPMLEMCRPEKIRFIDEILYIYNLETPNNDEKKCREEQVKLENWFRSKPKYHMLGE